MAPPTVGLTLDVDAPDAVAVMVADRDEEGEAAAEGVGGEEAPPNVGLTLAVLAV